MRETALLLLFLCCCIYPVRHSEGEVMTITKGHSGKTIQLRVSDIFQVELSGTPTTGFWWYIQVMDEDYVEFIKEYTKKSLAEKLDGGRLFGIWKFRAKKVGSTTIKMAYYRLWEDSTQSKEQFWIILQIRPSEFKSHSNLK